MTSVADKVDNKGIKSELKGVLIDAALHGLAELLRTAGRRLKELGGGREPECESETENDCDCEELEES